MKNKTHDCFLSILISIKIKYMVWIMNDSPRFSSLLTT